MKYYLDTVPKATQGTLHKIKTVTSLKNFYLSGGTALSIQLGHRESEDLDFFSKTSFQPQQLQQQLLAHGSLEDVQIDEGTLNLFMNGVKVQFLYYPYALLEEPQEWEGIYLSSVVDIACTKLLTISMRGGKKDFIDLFVILQNTTLKELFSKLNLKYQNVAYNQPHILKSLVYFTDADTQPMPRMHTDIAWDEVKDFFIQQAKRFKF